LEGSAQSQSSLETFVSELGKLRERAYVFLVKPAEVLFWELFSGIGKESVGSNQKTIYLKRVKLRSGEVSLLEMNIGILDIDRGAV
jgi:hypothetical protein